MTLKVLCVLKHSELTFYIVSIPITSKCYILSSKYLYNNTLSNFVFYENLDTIKLYSYEDVLFFNSSSNLEQSFLQFI